MLPGSASITRRDTACRSRSECSAPPSRRDRATQGIRVHPPTDARPIVALPYKQFSVDGRFKDVRGTAIRKRYIPNGRCRARNCVLATNCYGSTESGKPAAPSAARNFEACLQCPSTSENTYAEP